MRDRTMASRIPRGRYRTEIGRLLAVWGRNIRTRQALETLPDHILDDIGVSRDEARREARKPFWRS